MYIPQRRSYDFRKVRSFALCFLLGAFLTALVLENRASAIVKAFTYPQAVNAMQIEVVIEKK